MVICHDASNFLLPGVLTLLEKMRPIILAKPLSKNAKSRLPIDVHRSKNNEETRGLSAQPKRPLFNQIFGHHQRFTNADGLLRFYKFCLTRDNLPKHRGQNLFLVKTGQSGLNKRKRVLLSVICCKAIIFPFSSDRCDNLLRVNNFKCG